MNHSAFDRVIGKTRESFEKRRAHLVEWRKRFTAAEFRGVQKEWEGR